jgi:pre-mRNA-splicing helicase BRR2
MEMENEDRNALLKMSEQKLAQFAAACNRYPDVDMEIEEPELGDMEEGDEAVI